MLVAAERLVADMPPTASSIVASSRFLFCLYMKWILIGLIFVICSNQFDLKCNFEELSEKIEFPLNSMTLSKSTRSTFHVKMHTMLFFAAKARSLVSPDVG